MASLVHIKAWLAKAGAVVTTLAREVGLMDAEPPRPAATCSGEALLLAYRFSRWSTFTHAFSRVFYPKRFPLWRAHTILTG